MKLFKIFLILSAVIAISYFSWNWFISRSLLEKHERATLVMEECCSANNMSCMEWFLCI